MPVEGVSRGRRYSPFRQPAPTPAITSANIPDPRSKLITGDGPPPQVLAFHDLTLPALDGARPISGTSQYVEGLRPSRSTRNGPQ
jgi:hypothetical protein